MHTELEGVLEDGCFGKAYVLIPAIVKLFEDLLLLVGEGLFQILVMPCHKTSLDIFWIKDKSLADLDNLPSPDELAEEIIENLQSALESFMELKGQLGS